MKISALGDDLFIKAFELVGVEGFKASNEKEIREHLTKLIELNEHAIIIIPERYVESTKDIRERLIKLGRTTPIFAFLPDHTGETGLRVKELQDLISLAVGIKMKFE